MGEKKIQEIILWDFFKEIICVMVQKINEPEFCPS